MKNTAIKICGNGSLKNSLAVAQLKPTMMGFIFYSKSKRYTSFENTKEMIKNIEHIQTIGVFVNEEIKRVIEIVKDLNLAGIQVHGNESPEICKELRSTAFVIKALDGNAVNLQEQINTFKNCVDYYLLDNMSENYGGSGKHFNFDNLKNIDFPHPFFLAGGIGPDDVALVNEFKSNKMFYGIDLNSRFETSPGMKDILALQTFISAIQ